MPYEFTKLSDAQKIALVPENGNVLFEQNGSIYKAPIKQGADKEIKYITAVFKCEENGEINDYYSTDGLMQCILDGNNVPYIITSADILNEKYTQMSGDALCALYEKSVELRLCVATYYENESSVPTALNEYKQKSFKSFIPINDMTCVFGILSESGANADENAKIYVKDNINIPYLEVVSSGLNISFYSSGIFFQSGVQTQQFSLNIAKNEKKLFKIGGDNNVES